MHIRPYEKLIVWQEAHHLCVAIYSMTRTFPKEERYGLIAQMRRSGSSIPTNLAERSGRKTAADKAHFVTICIGSLEELHYQSKLSLALGYITKDIFDRLDDHIMRVGYLLHQLRNSDNN